MNELGIRKDFHHTHRPLVNDRYSSPNEEHPWRLKDAEETQLLFPCLFRLTPLFFSVDVHTRAAGVESCASLLDSAGLEVVRREGRVAEPTSVKYGGQKPIKGAKTSPAVFLQTNRLPQSKQRTGCSRSILATQS
jgi:hypothetical protein